MLPAGSPAKAGVILRCSFLLEWNVIILQSLESFRNPLRTIRIGIFLLESAGGRLRLAVATLWLIVAALGLSVSTLLTLGVSALVP